MTEKAKDKDTTDKICVVGWCDYDDPYFDDCDITDEVFDAVVDEVRRCGYVFGGNTHTDGMACCPVLSNDRCARFSWRDWGAVMATAYNFRTKSGGLDYMHKCMDELDTPRYCPYAYVDFSRIAVPRTVHRLGLSPARRGEMHIFDARIDGAETCDIERSDYIEYHNIEGKYARLYRVVDVSRYKSIEQMLSDRERYCTPDAEAFGFADDDGRTLAERLCDELTREGIDKHGIVCFTLEIDLKFRQERDGIVG